MRFGMCVWQYRHACDHISTKSESDVELIQTVWPSCAELVENVTERKFTFLLRSLRLPLRSFLYV